MNRIFLAIASLFVFTFCLAPSAQARDWHYAETERFRIYAYDTQDDVVEFAQDLERLDQAMRILSGIGPAAEPTPYFSKVTIYRFGETRDIGALVDSRNVGGFFIGRAGQPLAFVPRQPTRVRGLGQRQSPFELDPRGVLYHEYAHYFMYNVAAAAYPSWFREGFAELFYTIQFEGDRFVIGEPPASRAYALGRLMVDTRKMFDTGEEQDSNRVYGHGWLLSSHLLFNPARQGQLNTYLRQINEGQPSMEAAEAVFGDLRELDRELNDYRRSAARLLRVPFYDASTPEVDVRRLTPGEETVIDMVIRSKVGVTEEMAQRQVPEARSAVERFSDDLPVLLAAIEVEFDAGNLDEAEALADRALALDPQSIVAANYRASVSLRRAVDDPAHYAEARTRFARATQIDSAHPEALIGYYNTFVLANEPPTETAAIALESAYRTAPYDDSVRTTLAHLLMTEDRDAEALVVMGPVINNPHSGIGRSLREKFESEDPADRVDLLERLRPKPFGYEPPEDDADDGEGGEG